MSDELSDTAAGLVAVLMFGIGMWVGSCNAADDAVAEFDSSACELSCQRHRAGKAHSVDQTYCTCTSGVALKRDRSRLYVRVGGKQ